MKVFAGTDAEYGDYRNPGMKFFDLSRDALPSWFTQTWWPGHAPDTCPKCGS
jgi:hypothetical protein